MDKKYELKLGILEKEYMDQLIVALVHQGYDVYYNSDDNIVCFTIRDDELTEIKPCKHR